MRAVFTYCVLQISTGKRYYGSRYAKGCHPSQLGVTYFTSSKYVKSLIITEGLANFNFEVRKTFSDIDKCRAWEAKVLKRLDAAKSTLWLNRHNGGQKFYNLGNSPEHRAAISAAHQRNHRGRGIPKPQSVKDAVSKAHKGRIHSQETRALKSKQNSGSNNPMYGRSRKGETHRFTEESKKTHSFKIACQVVCDGIEYVSIGAAQAAYPGINLRKRLNNPKYPNFFRLRPITRRPRLSIAF